MPLLLDEPLPSADPQRRGITLDFLCALSERHQIMLTTSDPAIAQAVATRLGSAASITTLATLTPAVDLDGIRVATAPRRARRLR